MKNVTVIDADKIEHKGKRYEKVLGDVLVKKGDFFQRKEINSRFYTKDAFYKVKRVDYNGDVYVKDDYSDIGLFGRDNGVLYRKVSKTTLEEEAKWAAIGRKPGEFKAGDIVRSARYVGGKAVGTIFEIISTSPLGAHCNEGKVYFAKGAIELIAPVESTFK